MFTKTRHKLTLYFAGIFIVFMIVINGICYFLLSSIIYSKSEKEIQILADIELEEHAPDLIIWNSKTQHDSGDGESGHGELEHGNEHEGDRNKKEDITFLLPVYYVIDSNGQWVAGNQQTSLNETEIIGQLSHWLPKTGEAKYITYKSGKKEEVHLLFAGRSVYKQGIYWGSVYTGADITQQVGVFQKLMAILLALSVVFFFISVFLGYVMSGRAMVPIVRSFERQRQFVADASHELRTPLSVIQSSMEVIEFEEGDRMQTFSKQVLDDMKDEVKRMSSLIAHLLTLARSDSDELQLQLESFSVNDELGKIWRKLQPLASENRLQLSIDANSGLQIHADRERFRQLMMILIDNAMQYTPENGQIRINAKQIGNQCLLSVSDTGIGIPKDKLKDIFERFYQVDPSRSGGNSGLGLSIARWIVESHGGTIKVESDLGKGSTFTVILPVDAPASR